MKPKNYTGLRFGSLIAIKNTYTKNISGSYIWEFKCDCGNYYKCAATVVKQKNKISKNNNIPSCGCKVSEAKSKAATKAHTKHGYLKGKPHPLYSIYNAIMSRCYNKNTKSYKDYGAKGVTMCDTWLHHPEMFIKWSILNGWKKGLEIDKDIKIKNSKIYSPSTCTYVSKAININFSHSRETAFGKNKAIKLSVREVNKIIKLYATKKYSQYFLSRQFKVSRSAIQRILRLAKENK